MITIKDITINCSNFADVEEIRDEIASELHFPDYYGQNWDAWEECMRDLDWIDKTGLIVIRLRELSKSLPNIDKLLSSIKFVTEEWRDEDFMKQQDIPQKYLNFDIVYTDNKRSSYSTR